MWRRIDRKIVDKLFHHSDSVDFFGCSSSAKVTTSLRDIDLGLALDTDRKALVRDGEAVIGVKGVANCGASSVRQIGDGHILSALTVGGEDEHVAEGVGEEVVHHVSFHVVVGPTLSGLACLVDGRNELVHVALVIHDVPKCLTVSRVVSSTEALFISVVEEGDAPGCQSESNRILEPFHVVPLGKEAGVVMIVHEGAEDVDVLEGACVQLIVPLSDLVHRLA